jgi:hypothetical protein
MSKRRIVRLPAFNSVAAGSRATCALPVGARKYHKVFVEYKDGTGNQAALEADLSTVRLLVNGRPQREHTVAEINVLNAFRGRSFQTGTVQIHLSEPTARTLAGEEILGWGTNNLATFSLEIDIAAGATAPALVAYAEIEDSVENLGAILKVRRGTYQASGATTLAIRDLPRDPSEAYARFHAFTSAATAVQLKADADIIVETITRALLLKHYASRPQETIMQTNVLTLDLMSSTQVTDVLPMLRTDGRLVQDFPLEITLSGAATFALLTEVVGPAL